ncbi:LptF/LptG family permease [Parasphaerochaeta coccoides]|uniref:Permease YjgP/YjgQ family protein n=1 Tax=Parasphaerochaeta coccoides (strain ATCC BAA-1237 / DSM 17374 / SPN1) TaxID=760011 RepID=F4GK58_PARC1|nr:LptF/LptG family permease [Parasphaerochaeta coccoides]AEC01830.1 permease YjgP/YjgQ family protein [Parasphaerochaeta coccoides DSM 17374]
MKILDRYIMRSFLTVFLSALGICTLLLVAVDLFTNLDSYAKNEVPFFAILRLTVLYIPDAVSLVISPAVIFSATLTLALIHSSNELIPIFCAGIPYIRVIIPMMAVGICVSMTTLAATEYIVIPSRVNRVEVQTEYTGSQTSKDNRNITFVDASGRFVLHAKRYDATRQRIMNMVLIERDGPGGRMTGRTSAGMAQWDETERRWILSDVSIQNFTEGDTVLSFHEDTLMSDILDIEPGLFSYLGTDIKNMDRKTALWYLDNMKGLDPYQWATAATDYYERAYSFLTPFILMIIACSMNYQYKKNVLLFSILTSIGIAIVFYVTQLVTLLLAKQYVISPLTGVFLPLGLMIALSSAFFLRVNRV